MWLCTFLSSIFKANLKRGYVLFEIVGKVIFCSSQIWYFHLSDFIVWRALIRNNNSVFQLKSNFPSFQNICEMCFEWNYIAVYLQIRKSFTMFPFWESLKLIFPTFLRELSAILPNTWLREIKLLSFHFFRKRPKLCFFSHTNLSFFFLNLLWN